MENSAPRIRARFAPLVRFGPLLCVVPRAGRASNFLLSPRRECESDASGGQSHQSGIVSTGFAPVQSSIRVYPQVGVQAVVVSVASPRWSCDRVNLFQPA